MSTVASILGVDVTSAALIIATLFTMVFIFVIIIATKGRKADISIPATGLISFILWIILGWYPIWIGAVVAFMFALLLAKTVIH
jgi:hypothetical protein